MSVRIQDKKPYIEAKDVIVARSGIYVYTREEVLARGHKPAVVKDTYLEYRPPAVIISAMNMFDMVPVPNSEHIADEITPDNFHEHTSAMIGGPISVVAMPDGIEIGLKGRIAFFTKEAYDYYKSGNKETSADYVSESVLVDNPDKVGYDLIMTKILSVNNVAITARGRGGKDVRIQDSAPQENVIDKILGRRDSMGLLTHILDLGKKPEKTFSAAVKDSLVRAKALSDEDRGKEVEAVMSYVSDFTDSDIKTALIGVVRDSFTRTDQVLAAWGKSEKVLNTLYARCVDAEQALASTIKEAADEGSEEDDEAKKKEEAADKAAREKDSASAREKDAAAIVDAKIAELTNGLPGMIEEGIKKALKIKEPSDGGGQRINDTGLTADLETNVDAYVEDAFGSSSRV